MAIAVDPDGAVLPERLRLLVDHALRVARDARSVRRETLDELRARGLADEDLLNASQIAGFFSYYNRLVEALGIEDEAEWRTSPVAAAWARAHGGREG